MNYIVSAFMLVLCMFAATSCKKPHERHISPAVETDEGLILDEQERVSGPFNVVGIVWEEEDTK